MTVRLVAQRLNHYVTPGPIIIIIIIIMDNKCRLSQQHETIDHIISACPILAKEQYVKRHDKESAQIHFNICKEIGVQLDKKHWYEHVPTQ